MRLFYRNGVFSRYYKQKSRELGWEQLSGCCKQTICLHCYYEHSKCSLTLTHAVRWWRHCWTAHAWWYGLEWPTQ